jgi:hypothetical protein
MSGVSGTKEWSETSENTQVGCEHGCLYGYCRANAKRWGRIKRAEDWEHPVLNLSKLRRKTFPKRDGTIMYPSLHDITPLNIDYVIPYLKLMLRAGNRVLIVSKPHLSCVVRMCEELATYKEQILFRFTIGSTKSQTLILWEPGATSFEERFEALRWAHSHGFATSVSSEPYLDSTIVDLVGILAPYINDAHWIGLMNKIDERVNTSKWGPAQWAALEAVKSVQDKESIFMLYNAFKDNKKVKWKESVKKVVGLPLAREAGLDV